MTRIGIIGCGGIAKAHINAYQKNSDVNLVAFCDIQRAKAEEWAEKLGGKAYSDYSEMLENEHLDGVSVCTPASFHKESVVDCFHRGVSVLCEKPLAHTVEDAQEMVEASKRSKGILMVGFCYRFYEPVQRAKELVEKGNLGKVTSFRTRFGGKWGGEGRGWFGKKNFAAGSLADTSSHSIDLFRFLIGEPVNVSARVSAFYPQFEVEDTGTILLQSADGVIGIIESSWGTPFSEAVTQIYGTEGAAIVDYHLNELRYRTEKTSQWIEVKQKGPDRFEFETRHFVTCVLTGTRPLVSADDGLKVLKILDAAYRSVAEKKWVEISR